MISDLIRLTAALVLVLSFISFYGFIKSIQSIVYLYIVNNFKYVSFNRE